VTGFWSLCLITEFLFVNLAVCFPCPTMLSKISDVVLSIWTIPCTIHQSSSQSSSCIHTWQWAMPWQNCEIPWECVPYLSALEVWPQQGAIQIHIYRYLYMPKPYIQPLKQAKAEHCCSSSSYSRGRRNRSCSNVGAVTAVVAEV